MKATADDAAAVVAASVDKRQIFVDKCLEIK